MLLWILNLGFAASGADAPPTPTPTPDATVTGGYAFFNDYDAYRQRSSRRKRDERKTQAEVEEIQAELDRNIAQLLHAQEARDAERDELQRIQALADRFAGTRQSVSRRVAASLLKAQEERTRNALQQLSREIERMIEEEEVAVIQLLLNDD